MIQDKVRTASYAKFIMTSPELFRDAVVLDVGCGTGILSLFAARAGAKRVFAVDASDIAEKAQQIVKANNFDHIITYVTCWKLHAHMFTSSPVSFGVRWRTSNFRTALHKWMSLSPNGWDTLSCTSRCWTLS